MSISAPALFCLNSSRAYAQRVAAKLDVALSEHEERAFEDGEHKSRALSDVDGRDVYVVQSLYGEPTQSVNDKLCRLLFFIGSLKDAGAARVTAVVPYLCYARKDQRTQPHDPVTTRYVAALFEAVGTDCVMTFDVHNLAAFENAFRCRTVHLRARSLFVDYFQTLAQAHAIAVVAPDFGGAKRAEEFRRDLIAIGTRKPGLLEPTMALMQKRRSGGEISGDLLVGDVRGKTAIILDDLISSGSTLRRAALACRAAGAERIYAAATHGLFMQGAIDMINDPALDNVIVTDTVPPFRLDARLVGSRVHVVDSTALLAAAIQSQHAAY